MLLPLLTVVLVAAAPCRTSRWDGDALRAPGGVDAGDLDGDGRPDGLRITGEGGGSMESGFDVELRLSTRKAPVTVELTTPFDRFVTEVPIPEALRGPERAAAREAVEDALFHTTCATADPSLAWLLDGAHRLRWHPGAPTMPETYAVPLKSGKAWVQSLGENHRRTARNGDLDGTFRLLDAGDSLKLLGTAHGVVLRDDKRDRYAWIFVQPGGQKLRWPTIVGARFDGDSALIDVELAGADLRGLVRVELSSGRVEKRFCESAQWSAQRHACEGR